MLMKIIVVLVINVVRARSVRRIFPGGAAVWRRVAEVDFFFHFPILLQENPAPAEEEGGARAAIKGGNPAKWGAPPPAHATGSSL